MKNTLMTKFWFKKIQKQKKNSSKENFSEKKKNLSEEEKNKGEYLMRNKKKKGASIIKNVKRSYMSIEEIIINHKKTAFELLWRFLGSWENIENS